MAKLVGIFISDSYRRGFVALIWLISLLCGLGLIGWFALAQVNDAISTETRTSLATAGRLRANIASTLDTLGREVTAPPCSDEFNSQMRKVAYLPDGLNELLFAPGGIVRCSANVAVLSRPVDLGKPDMTTDGGSRFSVWLDKDLGFLGLDDLEGTIVGQGQFAAVVPKQNVAPSLRSAIRLEQGVRAPDGRWWHRGGEAGVYHGYVATHDHSSWLPVHDGAFHRLTCETGGLYCVAAEAALSDIAWRHVARLAVAIVAAILCAAWLAGRANVMILRYWSLEARLQRNLVAKTIVLAYQPIMHLESGEISGCEVLCRWRDLDESLVYPDQFIGIIERRAMTAYFTRLVAERACGELCEAIPDGRRLQVNFNVFPRDLHDGVLPGIFSVFDQARGRFDVVLEIVESAAVCVENAQQQIELLRDRGIRTQIDDFGTGYSNVANLAALPVDGVKLDRSFAMAPDGTMTAQMLGHAIDMVHATGRKLVIEGIETGERLAQLRRIATEADYGQGYFISRPLPIEQFAAFLVTHRATPAIRGLASGRTALGSGSRAHLRKFA